MRTEEGDVIVFLIGAALVALSLWVIGCLLAGGLAGVAGAALFVGALMLYMVLGRPRP